MRFVANYSMLGEKPTGLGVYADNCLDIQRKIKTTVISSCDYFPYANDIIRSPSNIAIGTGRLAAIRRQIWARKIRFSSTDLLYSPTHHGLPGQANQIITIHDLISLRFPTQHYPQYLFFRFFIPSMLSRCAAVFVVSEATKTDIIKYYKFPKEKIFVVPNAVDTDSFRGGYVNTDSPYLLMVGARYPHKNVEEVISNSSIWRDKYRLLITSCSGKYRSYLEKLVFEKGLSGSVEFLDYLDRSELIKLYQGCSALVYPSKWEGFGIPPLEALACGRPVIASDIPAHREVLGDSGLFVELGNSFSWRSAIAALEESSLVSDLVSVGRFRLNIYSKENAVAALEKSLLAVAPELERAI